MDGHCLQFRVVTLWAIWAPGQFGLGWADGLLWLSYCGQEEHWQSPGLFVSRKAIFHTSLPSSLFSLLYHSSVPVPLMSFQDTVCVCVCVCVPVHVCVCACVCVPVRTCVYILCDVYTVGKISI